MKVIVDTSFLIASVNRKDVRHMDCARIVRSLTDTVIVPVTVLPEAGYLIDKQLGHTALRRFLLGMIASDMVVEQVGKPDLVRSHAILEQYADARVDFVDATIVALAERLGVTRVLTLDQRHFRLFRPAHCPAFELLP